MSFIWDENKMRKIIVSEFVTLDGVMQAPGSPDEDRRGGFEYGGWQQLYYDKLEGSIVINGIEASGGFLLGRRTYEIFAGYWPNQSSEDTLASMINRIPKYVLSTTLKEPLTWSNSSLIKGDVEEEVTKLKQQDGKNLLVIGSGELVQTLMKYDLIDEYSLMMHPIVLGSGMRLFRDESPKTSLKLVDSKTTTTGVMILTYQLDRINPI
jgi:dihydrofolate reductase